uniref:Uncharacterized protein n=1 Tax=Plectus sambesii TaxID=2011161 RepID=A0A914W1D0_9BILA
MVKAVAALLLVVAVSNVGALECPSGSLPYSNEELNEMEGQKINEKLDKLEVTCTVNGVDAWCYSVLLPNEASTVIFHCADPSTARECAQLSAQGKLCNDEGTFCCCNSSVCKAVLSYPFIKNNGTHVVPLPISNEEHQTTPAMPSKQENSAEIKKGRLVLPNASSEEHQHNDTSHQTEDVHQNNSTNTSDQSQEITTSSEDSTNASSENSSGNSTIVNLSILERGYNKNDRSNEILMTNRSSAEDQLMEVKANGLTENKINSHSANDSKENSTEALDSNLSSETSNDAEIHVTPHVNSTSLSSMNRSNENFKRSTMVHKLTNESNSSMTAEGSHEDHLKPKKDKINQSADESAARNVTQHVHKEHSVVNKVLSENVTANSNSTEIEKSSEHRVLIKENVSIQNATVDNSMETENETIEHEQEFIQNATQTDPEKEDQLNNHTATHISDLHSGKENSTIDHEQHLSEKLISADLANSADDGNMSNATSEKVHDLTHDVVKADSAEDHNNHTVITSSTENLENSTHKSVEGSKEIMDKPTNHSLESAEATEPPSMKDLCPVLPTTPCADCSRSTTDAASKDPEEDSPECPAALSGGIPPTTVMWVMWIAPWIILLPIICVLFYLLRKSGKAVERLTEASTSPTVTVAKTSGGL